MAVPIISLPYMLRIAIFLLNVKLLNIYNTMHKFSNIEPVLLKQRQLSSECPSGEGKTLILFHFFGYWVL